MTNLTQALLSNAYTYHDIERRLLIAQHYFDSLFYNTAPPSKASIKEYDDEWYKNITNHTPTKRKDAYKALNDAMLEVKKAQPFIMYVACPLSPTSYQTIGMWIQKNVSQSALLRIRIEPTRSAGCAFSWNGIYHDYSISHSLDDKRTNIRDFISAIRSQSTQTHDVQPTKS